VLREDLNTKDTKEAQSLPAAAGRTILEIAEGAGVSIATMCRAGVCGTCRVRLTTGEADGDFDALDHSDRTAGWVLACVARPRGDCPVALWQPPQRLLALTFSQKLMRKDCTSALCGAGPA
jgi:ferredoxin